MADVRNTTATEVETVPEAPPSPTHVTIRREDYRPPDWLVPELRLGFDLEPDRTLIRARLEVKRNGEHQRPLRLDGEELRLLSVKADGRETEYRIEGDQLVIELDADAATIQTEVEINPAAN